MGVRPLSKIFREPSDPHQNSLKTRKTFHDLPTPSAKIFSRIPRPISKNNSASPHGKFYFKKFYGNEKKFHKNFFRVPEIFPVGILKESGTQQPKSPAVKPLQNTPSRNPIFPDPDHPRSGPCTGPDSPLFRNGAPYAPGLGSSDPLFGAKVLEDFHKDRGRMIVYDGEGDFTSEIIPPEYPWKDTLR
jgi:hypothetical protein